MPYYIFVNRTATMTDKLENPIWRIINAYVQKIAVADAGV